MKVKCTQCGVEFNKPPCQVKRVKQVFCSKKCHDESQTVFKGKQCEICGDTFKYRGNMSRYSTCSKPECRKEKVRREHEKLKKGTKAQRVAEMRRKNPDKRYLVSVKHLYGISAIEYTKALDYQEGACAICGCVPDKKLVVDHCHTSSIFRGLLCHSCNIGLGAFKDNELILKRAIEYLRRHGIHLTVQKGESDGE